MPRGHHGHLVTAKTVIYTMGDFLGHIIPGTFFIIGGFWWTFSVWWEYFSSKAQKRPFQGRCAYPLPGKFRPYCFEAFIKFACSAYGLKCEITSALHGGKLVVLENTHHISMYLFYVLSGIVDVLTNNRFPLPPGTDYVALFFAFVVEGLLFHFHLHGRPPLNVLTHSMLVYVIAAQAACIITELNRPHSVLAALGRGYFATLQGTWFCQLAFIVYGRLPDFPAWEENDPDNLMFAASVFAWHMFGCLLYTGVLGFLVWGILRVCNGKCLANDKNKANFE